MKRYNVYAANDCDEACDCTSRAVESPKGEWCKASDVTELLDKMRLWADELHGIRGGSMAQGTIRDVERALNEAGK